MSRAFITKIVHAKLTLSPFSAEQMADIGNVVLNDIQDRIKQAKDVTDSPAKPLVERYARRKILRGRAPVRDLTWRGVTMASLKVKRASEDMVTLGPVNPQADQIITANNRRSKQWGMSPKNFATLRAVLVASLKARRFTWTKAA